MVSHIYVHIPYCTNKCDYCDFYSEYPKQTVEDAYVKAVISELKERYGGELVATVFFGGGTPSLLNGEQLKSILSKINLAKNHEVTIECNPETITLEKLRDYKAVGVNRISIGVQSFDDGKLRLIGRTRNINVMDKIEQAITVFDNVGIDLMYALPTQNNEDIVKEISYLLPEVKHVSYYALTLEEGTRLFNKMEGEHPINDDLQADLTEEVVRELAVQDFERYEISNFAKDGYECQHNMAYWMYQDYLGIGAGAVSTIQGVRTENVKDIRTYTKGDRKGNEYKLTADEQANEKLMMQLRTTKGMLFEERLSQYTEKYPDLLCVKDGRIIFTNKGFLVHDTIVSELML
ncbi:MAG: radical SAM family heme chaperone HemW [Candidatus Riflemargulisbacteria bacterium]